MPSKKKILTHYLATFYSSATLHHLTSDILVDSGRHEDIAGQLTEIGKWLTVRGNVSLQMGHVFQNLSKYSKGHLNSSSPSCDDFMCLRYYYFKLVCKPTGSRMSFFHDKLVHRKSEISEQLF